MGCRARLPAHVIQANFRSPRSGWERLSQNLRRARQQQQEMTSQLGVMMRKLLLCVGVVAAASQMTATCTNTDVEPELFSYEVVAEYPHDHQAFTQGLHYERVCEEGGECKGVFWESTGMNGQSSVRKVDVSSGRVLAKTQLEHHYFGEGLAKLGDVLFQLTWLSNHLLVYDSNLKQIAQKHTPLHDGWGLTTDGKELIATDGSDKMFFIEPHSLELLRHVNVTDQGQPIKHVNELEWIDGEVWANIWLTDCIARIDPQDGRVKSWVLMDGLRDSLLRSGKVPRGHQMDVLNGIAWDPHDKRLFLTGKWWPRLYEVKINKIADTSDPKVQAQRRACARSRGLF